MTVTREQIQDALDWINKMSEYDWEGCLTETIRTVLQEALDARNVDVEALKRPVDLPRFLGAYHDQRNLELVENKAWNAAIDHLSANGYLTDQSATIDALAGALEECGKPVTVSEMSGTSMLPEIVRELKRRAYLAREALALAGRGSDD